VAHNYSNVVVQPTEYVPLSHLVLPPLRSLFKVSLGLSKLSSRCTIHWPRKYFFAPCVKLSHVGIRRPLGDSLKFRLSSARIEDQICLMLWNHNGFVIENRLLTLPSGVRLRRGRTPYEWDATCSSSPEMQRMEDLILLAPHFNRSARGRKL
jgi:hypothetical protein